MDHAMKPAESAEGAEGRDEPARGISFSSLKPRGPDARSASPAKDRPKPAERPPLKDAIQFRNSAEYEKYLLGILEKHGLDAPLYEQLRIFYASAGDVAALQRVWRHLPDLGFSDPEGWLERAEVLRQMDRMDLALEYIEKYQRARPDDPHATYAMAMYFKLQHDYEVAVHWLKKWQRLDPRNPEVYYHLGTIYRRIHSVDLARLNLMECLRLDGKYPLAQALLDKLNV